MKPRHFAKKLTKKQKAVVPNLYAAVVEAEGKSVEECEERLKSQRRGSAQAEE